MHVAHRLFPAVFLGTLLAATGAPALVRLPAVLGSNMVLQRDAPIPIWGWAEPSESVAVTLADKSVTAKADATGRWQVKLDPQPAGGPVEITVRGKDNTLTLANVLFGDVWVCSGQSNMQFGVNGAVNAAQEIADAAFPRIRLFIVPNVTALTPAADCAGQWVECSPQTVPGFSAVGYFFGRELHRQLAVPIGLIGTSWGGTPAESWTPLPAYETDPELAAIAAHFKEVVENYPRLKEEWPKAIVAWQEAVFAKDKGNSGFAEDWAAPDFDDAAWTTMRVPGSWKAAGLGSDGVVWFRQTVFVPDDWAGEALKLELDSISTFDVAYFSGVQVGATGKDVFNAAQAQRQYTVPGSAVKAGDAVLAVRISSAQGNGGFTGKAKQMRLTCPTKPGIVIALDGKWKYQVEQKFAPGTPPPPVPPVIPEGAHQPSVLYNAMIHPLIPFGIKGAIWYQGESNAGLAYQYRKLLPAMIGGWHTAWNQGAFPFLIVQLANFTPVLPEPGESDWAELREAQLLTADSVPQAGIAVAIDIGDAGNIHPQNKQEVGRRLALVALAKTYGKDVVSSGPRYASMSVEGDRILLKFKEIGGGLTATGGEPLKGFAIAGEDRKFVWAEATIAPAGGAGGADTVTVRSDRVAKPVAVRYAWANNPVCNFANAAGLPASPFRTDDWPGITAGRK